ncbi:hypothetical protein GCM10009737_07910 [Nocardioides lentus]|uniref:DUF7694 domain-containing protein n=1 Tax=Nocardioides lentus TaxID=338077 RepID=A0ABN2P3C2_9ACTN
MSTRVLSKIDPLRLRAVMGRADWLVPHEFGPAGWRMLHRDQDASILVSEAHWNDGRLWRHASMTRPDEVPSYDDLCRLKRAVWGDEGEAYAVFATARNHINIHERALHLWGLADGSPVLPNFGARGSI